jgi:hypothetical protein
LNERQQIACSELQWNVDTEVKETWVDLGRDGKPSSVLCFGSRNTVQQERRGRLEEHSGEAE